MRARKSVLQVLPRRYPPPLGEKGRRQRQWLPPKWRGCDHRQDAGNAEPFPLARGAWLQRVPAPRTARATRQIVAGWRQPPPTKDRPLRLEPSAKGFRLFPPLRPGPDFAADDRMN